MPDMKVQNGKVVYLDDAGTVAYSLPTASGSTNNLIRVNGSDELEFTTDLPYSAETASDWTVEPSLVKSGLDELASRIKTLEATVVTLQAAVDALENPPLP